MSKFFKKYTKRTYVYAIIALFYIPLLIGAIYSFSSSAKKGDMPIKFTYTGEGWKQLSGDEDIARAIVLSAFVAILVALIVAAISLLTVYGLWKQRNKVAKAYVNGTANIPLINPDIITAVSLSLLFGAMFGRLQVGDDGIDRIIIAQSTMILPFSITLMYPRSEKFRASMIEASKDLGFGPVRTWFKTYFRHMLPVLAASIVVSLAMSLDDFIITRVVSRGTTVGKLMYEGSLRPWVLALGTIMLAITLSGSIIYSIYVARKERVRKVKK